MFDNTSVFSWSSVSASNTSGTMGCRVGVILHLLLAVRNIRPFAITVEIYYQLHIT